MDYITSQSNCFQLVNRTDDYVDKNIDNNLESTNMSRYKGFQSIPDPKGFNIVKLLENVMPKIIGMLV